MIYEDRKMLKWKGFLLTEHTEQLQEKEVEKEEIIIDEQEKERFDQIINRSYHLKLPVKLLLNTFGHPYMEVTGVVQSIDHESKRLKLMGKGAVCIVDIVSIDFLDKEVDEIGHQL